MIQARRKTDFTAYIETEAKRIDTTVASTQIRHLMKFTNDLDGAVFYAYATTETIYDRYTKLEFTYGVADVYTGNLKLIPAGYFKYTAYEISWIGTVALTAATAPATDTDHLPVKDDNGVIQGVVAIGKLYLAEFGLNEEVQYTEYEQPASTNTIYYGQ